MVIEDIFITPSAGQPMRRVAEAYAMMGRGLEGDRYALGTGYYSGKMECEVTLIEGEVLDTIEGLDGLSVYHGEHRRNLVTRGIALRDLEGQQLWIGDVVLGYDRPRPPCDYVQRLTEAGMTRALGKGPGIGARVLISGLLRAGAEIIVRPSPNARPKRRLP